MYQHGQDHNSQGQAKAIMFGHHFWVPAKVGQGRVCTQFSQGFSPPKKKNKKLAYGNKIG
jgi:hypothetical protein